jgi:hypothetical protein
MELKNRIVRWVNGAHIDIILFHPLFDLREGMNPEWNINSFTRAVGFIYLFQVEADLSWYFVRKEKLRQSPLSASV